MHNGKGWTGILQARDRNHRVALSRTIFWRPNALTARRRAEALHDAFVRRYDAAINYDRRREARQ